MQQVPTFWATFSIISILLATLHAVIVNLIGFFFMYRIPSLFVSFFFSLRNFCYLRIVLLITIVLVNLPIVIIVLILWWNCRNLSSLQPLSNKNCSLFIFYARFSYLSCIFWSFPDFFFTVFVGLALVSRNSLLPLVYPYPVGPGPLVPAGGLLFLSGIISATLLPLELCLIDRDNNRLIYKCTYHLRLVFWIVFVLVLGVSPPPFLFRISRADARLV